MNLFPYQHRCVEFLTRDNRNKLFAGEPGIGKTPVAVRAADKIWAHRVLVICPPIALGVWVQHFEAWSEFKRPVSVIDNPSSPASGAYGVTIVGYSRVCQFERVLRASPWDVLILDETHYLKSTRAERTQAVYGRSIQPGQGIAGAAARVWCLTGTPVLNHAADLYPHLRALEPNTLIYQGGRIFDEDQFVEHFCVGRRTIYGDFQVIGSRNTEELHLRLKPFMLRMRKREVLKDLPPLMFVEHSLPPNTPINEALKREMRLRTWTSMLPLPDEDDDEFLAALNSKNVSLSVVRRLLGEAKTPAVVELVEELLAEDPERKVLVFAHHRTVISALVEGLKKITGVIMIDGQVRPGKIRDNLIERFQTDDKVRVAVLQIVAAGTAATLHRADEVVFAEASWVPSENNQAASRAHRIGQTKSVTARFVVLPGTIDERIQATLARKARDIAGIVDGETRVKVLV